MNIIPAQITTPTTSKTIVSPTDSDTAFFRKLERMNINLNAKQIEAVRSTHPRLKVIAGSGCGKTLFLVARAAYLIDVRGVDPSDILVVSYTRKACQELKDRVDKLVCGSNIVVTTIHAFCYRILRANGLSKHRLLSDDTHKKSIIKGILRQLDYNTEYTPDCVLLSYTLSKSSMAFDVTCDENLRLLRIFSAYNNYKEEHKLIDFDDILTMAYELLSEQPQLCLQLQSSFHHILIDEFQDLCPLENQIISLLISSNNLCVVGDPRQTIFGFRGSDIRIIDSFEESNTDCQVINLDINYRSAPVIVGLGNQIMQSYHKLLTARETEGIVRLMQPKDLSAEAADIAEHIAQRISSGECTYKDFAVIYRASSCSSFVFDEFVLRNIPVTVFGGSPSIYDNGIVKLIMSHMRLAIDPGCMAAVSTITPLLYINSTAAMKFLRSRTPPKDCISALCNMPQMKDWQIGLIHDRTKLIRSIADMMPTKAVETLIRDKHIKKYLTHENQQDDTDAHDDVLSALKTSSGRFESISEFLSFVDKAARCAHSDNMDAVTLTSIHSSKGLEFRNIFLLNVIDGMIPHQRAIDQSLSANPVMNADLEEERRLLYVGVTRAADELIISVPKERDGRPNQVSRYLHDII